MDNKLNNNDEIFGHEICKSKYFAGLWGPPTEIWFRTHTTIFPWPCMLSCSKFFKEHLIPSQLSSSLLKLWISRTYRRRKPLALEICVLIRIRKASRQVLRKMRSASEMPLHVLLIGVNSIDQNKDNERARIAWPAHAVRPFLPLQLFLFCFLGKRHWSIWHPQGLKFQTIRQLMSPL